LEKVARKNSDLIDKSTSFAYRLSMTHETQQEQFERIMGDEP